MTTTGSRAPAAQETIRRYKSHPGAKVVQTRLVVALAVLALANLTHVFADPKRISWIVLAYIVFTVLLVLLSSTFLEQKRFRSLPDLFDLVVLSFLVKSTGGLHSSWFLLYVFPVMSASRYLGTGWSVMTALFATGLYGYASNAFEVGALSDLSPFGLRALVLTGVALTAANLAKTKERAEAMLVRAIEKIDLEIYKNASPDRVMSSILTAAIEITDSDLSAIALVDKDKRVTKVLHEVRPHDKEPLDRERDTSEAGRLVEKHCSQILESKQPLSLPQKRPFAAILAALRSSDESARWRARMVPLEIQGESLGVLGVFSRRALHYYTSNDLQKLSSMASLVAIAHKNAELVSNLASRETEVKDRLQMLYKIDEQLKADQGLNQVFQNVVTMVSARIGSEEAALFIPDDRGERIEKVAVSGPTAETEEKLFTMERSYQGGNSLTWQVFKRKESRLENEIPQDEAYAEIYSEHLPSRTARHYIGVPLLIGDEVLGVIRVLNKRADHYYPLPEKANLADGGFTGDDFELLTLIATQIASAISNAKFIERNKYFENLVYNSPDPIIVLDKVGNIENFNKKCEEIWGLSESVVLHQPVANYYESEEHARDIGRALWQDEDKHMIRDYEARIRDVDGNIIPILLSATLLLDRAGKPLGSIGVFKDKRDMLRLQDEKLRNEKLAALGNLARATGHDIKHDLATIMNYLDTLEEDEQVDPEVRNAYAEMREATTAILNKVQNMLLTARPKEPQKEPLSLNEILREFESSIAHQAAATQTVFSVNSPENDPHILADPEQMRQVFSNLFGNSLDAIKTAREQQGRRAGRIDLDFEVGEDIVLLTWRDDGCGMPKETQESAFTPFFTTKDNGSGLGLHITKTIVENHGGQIGVEPAGHTGACFRIIFPILHDDDNPEDRPI